MKKESKILINYSCTLLGKVTDVSLEVSPVPEPDSFFTCGYSWDVYLNGMLDKSFGDFYSAAFYIQALINMSFSNAF